MWLRFGTNENPLSSQIVSGKPSLSAFFYTPPIVGSPMVDNLRRMLGQFDAGFLIGVTEIIENSPHIGTTVINVPFFANEVGDDSRSPSVGGIASGDGTLIEDGFEIGELSGREFGFRTATRFSSEGSEPCAFDFFTPALDRGKGNFENLHDLFVVKAS